MQGTLKISGPDAKTLLQGQLTYDVEKITPTHSSLSAFCNPQGRVISLFTLSMIENDYYLTMPADLIPITINKLQKYAIFYKVTLTDITDTLPPTPNKQNNITAGIPAIYPATSEKFLPHDLQLHKHNAISFEKGCYTGQEIIARMQYLGKLKNHLYHAKITTRHIPQLGATLYTESGSHGYIVDYQSLDNLNFDILLIAQDIKDQLFLDSDKKEALEIIRKF